MKALLASVLIAVLLSVTPARAQHHLSNWVLRTAADTTIVPCWEDSITSVAFPANCMNMMMPESIFCRIDRMEMDSLMFPHDSTFLGWYRVGVGTDSMHFDMMNGDSLYGGHHMMQFMRALSIQCLWDSVMSDSMHRDWDLTGMMGWNGSGWVNLGGSINGRSVVINSSQIYSALAFIGTSPGVTSVPVRGTNPGEFILKQNYPNPCNPTTVIRYQLPVVGDVKLSVFDMLGREVSVLVNGKEEAGYHEVRFDGSGLASGVYLYRLQAGNLVQTRRLVFIK